MDLAPSDLSRQLSGDYLNEALPKWVLPDPGKECAYTPSIFKNGQPIRIRQIAVHIMT